MASISANGSRGHHNFTLNVWENSTDTPSNTSNVGWSLVLAPIQAGWDWNISGISWNVNVNGVGYSGTIQSYDGRSTVTIASNSLTVGHDNNGDKQIGFSFSINDGANRSYTPGSCSSSGSMWLSHINRWAIVTSANNFNDEQNPTMTFSNPAGYTMNVWLELNPTGDHLCIRNNIPNTGSYTWELTSEEREQLRARCTGNSATIRYGIYSNIGGSLYASYIDKTFTIVNGNPVFENFIYQDTNTTITNITGNNQVLVKGLSTLQATISTANKMTAIKEATEKNYVATIDTINQSQNYDDENDVVFNLGTINVSGTQKLNIRAYDSRNNSTLVSKDIRVYDYAKPVINFTAERLNNFEAQTTLKINGSFSSLNIDNVEKNTIQSVQYRYKESNSETWGNWTNVLFAINNNEFNCSNVIIALDNTKEFDVEVKVTDNLSDNNSVIQVDVGKSIFFISSNERKCYINDYEVATFNRVYPVGSIYLSVNNTDPVDLFGIGTWELITDKFLLGAGNDYNCGATGGEVEHALTINEMPSHSHRFDGVNAGTTVTGEMGNYPTYIYADAKPNWLGNASHSVGGGQAHNNMPPYLAVYIWKRIA